MAREITLVDAGLGNLASVERALIQVGAATVVTDDPDKVATSRIVVFPGQGAFGEHTAKLVDGAMGQAMRMVIQRGDPFLGICLGMQLLFEDSEEGGGRKGLNVLPGHCRRFPDDMTVVEGESVRKLKIPHMGWNEVQPSGEHYYFVHSYYVDATNSEDVMWSSTYGDITFAAAVRHDNIYGCQFHPEKSQQAGLRFLRAFLLGSRQ
ncbi:imidazole glycerol phosphate synthase subunit HisH [Pseudenhygromyxa sp. WMMC2535]|uniref:imidazole glycerol phosphate synthase subunit HisH n=1 Tax=Pseudenhygromyxa sp. WMMC2535 TaxID=2712867 RepID=UPI001551FED7|nr:imidazole glycerol phosphate synthase subunit HisH [Pseudenhygromyxa sp. WMMC2535]NVB38419.1 imidazole glycerol phosphate synthase subunit HisH [Pseudenhygromyxa sp. WMMC2535]